MGKLFYIMGKSATGKDHVYRDLLKDEELGLSPLVLYTTRPIRAGETDGKEYYFTDEAGLERLRREGKIIEERVYQTVYGPWHYFTADEGQICLAGKDYLGIGTLESYGRLLLHFGPEIMVPLYVETEDGLRLERAMKREKKQKPPKYDEMCRRFLADSEDFSEDRILQAGIRHRFVNNDRPLSEVTREVKDYILGIRSGAASTNGSGD